MSAGSGEMRIWQGGRLDNAHRTVVSSTIILRKIIWLAASVHAPASPHLVLSRDGRGGPPSAINKSRDDHGGFGYGGRPHLPSPMGRRCPGGADEGLAKNELGCVRLKSLTRFCSSGACAPGRHSLPSREKARWGDAVDGMGECKDAVAAFSPRSWGESCKGDQRFGSIVVLQLADPGPVALGSLCLKAVARSS
mgnify:CR=1 FL=1